ncbi:hypothetical protein IE81DRAFT_328254 [Ceraceosorus guamensis]|uniref:Uncharacterized protein n=1 Tax=Ceraceosorus guamensis TaxID=1522189 RepID=A0A316W6D9_9BASI|nr:hypothetical protein IE81DRAFT_328254 [Ceraceosorus guamensis]PWN45332.1 hypothetical protein IE81DRAFT_328254 [Ceraceosorus guamensis]
MLATPTSAFNSAPSASASTPPLSLSDASIAWLNSAASANEWVQRLASPDHFSHSSSGHGGTYKPTLRAKRSSSSNTSDVDEALKPSSIRPALKSSKSYAGRPDGPRRHVTVRLPEHVARRWPSARTEAQAWDAPWIAAMHDSDIEADLEDDDHHDDDESSTRLVSSPAHGSPRQPATAARQAQPIRPAVDSFDVERSTLSLRRTRTFAEAPKFDAAASTRPCNLMALRRKRRHVRCESAPEAFGQDLQLNTALPIERPSSQLVPASPLAYPVPFWDHSRAYRAADKGSLGPADKLPRNSSESSLVSWASSDGSCHGDAGDDDPEQQLATAIARSDASASGLRSAALPSSRDRRETSFHHNRRSVSLDDVDFDDVEHTDDDGHEIYSSAGPIAATISVLFGGQSLSRPTRNHSSRHNFDTAIRSTTPRRVRRVRAATTGSFPTDTPATLVAESRRGRNVQKSSGSWLDLAKWLVGFSDSTVDQPVNANASEVLSTSEVQPTTTARLPMPSAISRSSSLASLGSLNNLPSLVHDSDEADSDSSREESESSSAHRSWSLSFPSGRTSNRSEVDDDGLKAAWGDLAEVQASKAKKARAEQLRRKNQAITLRLTPVSSTLNSPAQGKRSADHAASSSIAPVSPLWDRHFDAEDSNAPYTRSWASVLGV